MPAMEDAVKKRWRRKRKRRRDTRNVAANGSHNCEGTRNSECPPHGLDAHFSLVRVPSTGSMMVMGQIESSPVHWKIDTGAK